MMSSGFADRNETSADAEVCLLLLAVPSRCRRLRLVGGRPRII